MAITKTSNVIQASVSVAAGTTKTSPNLTSAALNCTGFYGGDITYKITNGASAPAAACVLTFQSSQDGTNWYDYYTVAGDTTANSVNSNTILLDRGIMYLRVIGYGNTTNPVTVEAYLQAVTGV